MMASRFLKQQARASGTAASIAFIERGFERCWTATSAGLDVVLRHQFVTLCVFLATLAAHRRICSSSSRRASSRSRIPA